MREICLPLAHVKENEQIDIKVSIGKGRKVQNFRIEAFQWECEDELSECKDTTSLSLARIFRLKKSIESYDSAWELIQIFAPLENSKFIRVLYREIV